MIIHAPLSKLLFEDIFNTKYSYLVLIIFALAILVLVLTVQMGQESNDKSYNSEVYF